MTIMLKTTRFPQGFAVIGACAYVAFLLLSVVAIAAVWSAAYGRGLAMMFAIVLPFVLFGWYIVPVNIYVSPAGVRAGGRWIPRRELTGCEIQHAGPHSTRLLVRSTGGDWCSIDLDESRSKLEFVVAVVQLVMRPANSTSELEGPKGVAND